MGRCSGGEPYALRGHIDGGLQMLRRERKELEEEAKESIVGGAKTIAVTAVDQMTGGVPGYVDGAYQIYEGLDSYRGSRGGNWVRGHRVHRDGATYWRRGHYRR